jgi:hypothetical protein
MVAFYRLTNNAGRLLLFLPVARNRSLSFPVIPIFFTGSRNPLSAAFDVAFFLTVDDVVV